MSRQLAGSVLIAAAAILYGARHVGAMAVLATKTGDLREQYAFALAPGGELLALSVLALLAGVAYMLWGEYEARVHRP